jgi:oxepin-CoA hydrolase/3-oxo-5,6-dehydrosuberyl-CoA semialdehyde dehydrogenase
MKVDINKREELNNLLDLLHENTKAKWGLMKPQHMVEHLVKTLEFSNGKMLLTLKATEVEAKLAKERFIYTDVEMPQGLKSSLLGDVPDPFKYPGLDEAKKILIQELDEFHNHFMNHPSASFIHPRLGSLNYQEWIIIHNKHFTHHFKQFGLL